VGIATSGTLSPTFRKGIGLGYVKTEEAWEGNEMSIMIRQKKFLAEIVKLPFYHRYLAQGSEIRKDRKDMTVLREGSAL
jgi:aminomethyltransferase